MDCFCVKYFRKKLEYFIFVDVIYLENILKICYFVYVCGVLFGGKYWLIIWFWYFGIGVSESELLLIIVYRVNNDESLYCCVGVVSLWFYYYYYY